jgi:hypothetical protein
VQCTGNVAHDIMWQCAVVNTKFHGNPSSVTRLHATQTATGVKVQVYAISNNLCPATPKLRAAAPQDISKYCFSSNSCVLVFQTATKLLEQTVTKLFGQIVTKLFGQIITKLF